MNFFWVLFGIFLILLSLHWLGLPIPLVIAAVLGLICGIFALVLGIVGLAHRTGPG